MEQLALIHFSFSIFPFSIYLSVEVVSFRQRITGSPTITCRKSIRQCPGSVRHLCRMTWVFIGSLIVSFEMVRSIFPNPSFPRPCWWCGGWSRSIAATAPALQLMADCFTSSSRSESVDLLATYVLFTYHNGRFKNVHNNDKTKGAQNMQTEEMGENTWEFEVEAPPERPQAQCILKQKKPGRTECWFLWVDIPIVFCKLMDHAFAVRHFSVVFVHFGWQTVAWLTLPTIFKCVKGNGLDAK